MPTRSLWVVSMVAAALVAPDARAADGAGAPPPAAAAPLTLDEAVATALAGNQLIAAAGAQANAAAAAEAEAKSRRLPRVELQETYARTTNPVFVFMNLLGQASFGPGNFAVGPLNRPDPLGNFNTKLSVAQPLYAGGMIAAGAAAAADAREAAVAERERTRQRVVHQVVEAYSGAALAEAQLKVALEARETARAHVKLAEDLRAAGLVVDSDLLQAKVALAEVEEFAARAEADLDLARAGLNVAMGRPQETPVELPERIEERSAPDEPLPTLVAAALAGRRDLQAMQRRVAAAGEMVRVARAGSRPEVGLQAQYEMNKENAPGRDGSNWSVFVSAKFTPFDGGAARARARRAEEERTAASKYDELLRQGAELEVRAAWNDLRVARRRLDLASASAEQARAALAIVEDRYKEGLTTIVELLGAQTSLTAARTREAAARRDVLLARSSLDLAVGRL